MLVKRKNILIWTFLTILFLIQNYTVCKCQLKEEYLDFLRSSYSEKYDEAISSGMNIIDKYPDFPYIYESIALTFRDSKQFKKGMNIIDSILNFHSKNGYLYFTKGLLYKFQKKYDSAITNYNKCLELIPRFETAYFHLVEDFQKKVDLENILNLINKEIQDDSSNSAAFYGLGCIYRKMKETNKAIKSFERSLKINPEIPYAYYLIGVLYHKNFHEYEKALEVWDIGKDISEKLNDLENQIGMTCNVGNTFKDIGKPDSSLKYYDKSLKLAERINKKNEVFRILNGIGNTLKDIGKPDSALIVHNKAFDIAKEINDSNNIWMIIGNIGADYKDISSYEESIKYSKLALKMAIELGDSMKVFTSCLNLGATLSDIANYDEALIYNNRALKIIYTTNDKRSICDLLNNIAIVYRAKGEARIALDSLQKSLGIARSIPSLILESQILGKIGYAYTGLCDYATALNYLLRALYMSDSLNLKLSKGTLLGNIGLIYKIWGDIPKALSYINQAIIEDTKTSDLRGVIRHKINLANIFEEQGNYIEALKIQKKCLNISDSIDILDYSCIFRQNIGNVYCKLGKFKEANDYFFDAYKIAKSISNKDYILSILFNLGVNKERDGDDSTALIIYNEVLDSAESFGNKDEMVSALIAIANYYQNNDNYSKARALYNKAFLIAKEIGIKKWIGKIYMNLGDNYFSNKRLDPAQKYYYRANEIGKELNSFHLVSQSFDKLGNVYYEKREMDKALKFYQQSINEIESVRENLEIETYKTSFMEGKYSEYESIISLLIEMKRHEEAYSYLQRFKMRNFLDMMSPDRLTHNVGIPTQMHEKYKNSELKMRNYNLMLAYEKSKASEKQDLKIISEINDSLKTTKTVLENLIDEIRLNHPHWAELTGNAKTPELKDIQENAISEGDVIIEYYVSDATVAAWIIKKDTINFIKLPTNQNEIEKLVMAFRQPFIDAKEGKINNLADVNFDVEKSNKLYKKIFKPIEKFIPQNTELIIVPDGILHYLPFDALVTNKEEKTNDQNIIFSRYENLHYLIEKYSLSYVPSASILTLRKDSTIKLKEQNQDSLLAFGSPDFGPYLKKEKESEDKYNFLLKNSKSLAFKQLSDKDVIEVSNIVKPSAIFIGKKATEKKFKENAKYYPYIYLSTHALADEIQPMYSLIALAQDDSLQEDGLLHTYEVYNLQLNADLVTLSACETGLGKLSRGEGLIGLTRAFLYSGATSVLVSLWSVDETTSTIMKYFYQNIINGLSKSEALRQAKLMLIKTRENGISFSHPFLWAPFILVGQH
ncbi:MAG: tetratricopeptide repeat protein [Bacteroidetes bacterium]|nr:MAG: tetratricopeptide repeat protein [Bacteroidota bacterium]